MLFTLGLVKKPPSDRPSGSSTYYRERWNIVGYDRASPNYCSVADRHPTKQNRGTADPHIVTDRYTIPIVSGPVAHPRRHQHGDTQHVNRMILATDNLNAHADHHIIANLAVDLYDRIRTDAYVVTKPQAVRGTDDNTATGSEAPAHTHVLV
nr:hypothetical protein [Blastococcus sp. DSM 46786]